MFGEEDVVADNRPYSCTAKCISKSADVFCMKAEEFVRILSR